MNRWWATVGIAVGAITAAVVVECSMGRSASAAASKRPTWGQILIVCDESDGRHASRDVAELYDPLSNQFAAGAR
jgi:hypothetical protein